VATTARAFRAGALHFLEKPFSSHELLDTIHRALERDARMREHETRRVEARTLLESLTKREREVCEQLVVGVPVKAIAVNLKIAKKTCDVHRANLFRKMNVATTAELVWKYLLATARTTEAARPGPGIVRHRDFPYIGTETCLWKEL